MVKRVFEAAHRARQARIVDKIRMLWPELYQDSIPENDLLSKFRRLATEESATHIMRLTSDCPLISYYDIREAYQAFITNNEEYYNNRRDGFDVQIFTTRYLFDNSKTNREHVIADKPNRGGYSVDTPMDLAKVRQLWKNQ